MRGKFLTTLFTSALTTLSLFATNLSPEEAQEIAVDAYIYGYPLVTMEMTRRVMTNVETPTGTRAPMGQFASLREYPNASFREVTAPNADTLYSAAWLDLSKEPYVLQLPDENGRYYLMPMLSGWTEVFEAPGKRTTGTKAQAYAITGPQWKGQLPAGLTEYKSPTNLVWILGRTYCTGTPDDYKAVHAIQDKYSLVPLSAYGKSYTPPKGSVDSTIDMDKSVRDQIDDMNTESFFRLLATLLKDNPPALADAHLISRMKKIGITPGEDFELQNFDPMIGKAIGKAQRRGLEKIEAQTKTLGKKESGWIVYLNGGHYGTDYLARAAVAFVGLGANLSQDAIYPFTTVDTAGKLLDGNNKYVLHFDKDKLPPVKGFWSLTMYDVNYFFVPNILNRYTVSPRNALKYNVDGSLDLYIQNENPGKEKESNWLPAPNANFVLMLRLYWPEQTVINGTWQPPGVVHVE